MYAQNIKFNRDASDAQFWGIFRSVVRPRWSAPLRTGENMPLTRWPKLFRSYKDARVFFVSISLVATIFLAVISFSRYRMVNELLVQTMKHEAESYANLIVTTRHWNASYGGVYVLKKPGDRENPYLKQMGIDPDIRTADGRILTLKNPAIMTREISKLTTHDKLVNFHMISLKPLNPENSPNAFERNALERLEKGERHVWDIDRSAQEPVFRFVSPLTVKQPCLACHARQGYREGDIRGGVSILVPAAEMILRMSQNARQKAMDFLVSAGLLLAIIYSLTWKLFVRLDEVQRRLRRIAITDDLTGLRNRRHIMEQLENEYQRALRSGSPLSLMIIDIDNFKKINDQYGHLVGDEVLKAVADEMNQSLRTYDLLGRIGGEEFLIASPGSALEDAATLAERIRKKIKARKMGSKQNEIYITISAGVTSLDPQDAQVNVLLVRADEALYQAKRNGRDQIVIG